MYLIICPGIHSPSLTERFLEILQCSTQGIVPSPQVLVFPAADAPPYCPMDLLRFLHEAGAIEASASAMPQPSIFIGFSAGVVGAIGAAWGLQAHSQSVKAAIAFDGWGVPLYGTFPIHRISHDFFTHWSSSLLGSGDEGFYADPPVDHLALWSAPDAAWGWRVPPPGSRSQPSRTTAADFLSALLYRYAIAAPGDRVP